MAGQPAFKPTDEQRKMVEAMAAYRIPHAEIAQCVGDGIDAKTLRKHFRHSLDVAPIRAKAKVGEALFKAAQDGNITAAIFLSKNWLGYSDKVTQEVTGPDGAPLDLSGLTADERKLLRDILGRRVEEPAEGAG